MSLSERIGRLFCRTSEKPALAILPHPGSECAKLAPRRALATDRPLTPEERAIADWLLRNTDPSALDFLPQLDEARVVGHCTCGCPTIDLAMHGEVRPAKSTTSLINEATGAVGGDMVGVMLFQAGGHLSCLEVYDLSDIPHPYGLPTYSSLKRLIWESAQPKV